MAAITRTPLKLDNRFPPLPTLRSLKPEDQQALNQWWHDAQIVFSRQFNSLVAEIDKKQDKP